MTFKAFNFKHFPFSLLLIIIALVIFLLLCLSLFYYQPFSSCTSTKYLSVSLEVKGGIKNYIGLNSDSNSSVLNFGKVSSFSLVSRSVHVSYTKNALVKVIPEGLLSSWLTIKPDRFRLNADETKEVFFTLHPPKDTPDGEYHGRIRFCFIQK